MLNVNQLCDLLELDPLVAGLQIVAATELARDYFPRLDTDRPALVGGLASMRVARKVARTLIVNYPAKHRITLLSGGKKRSLTLSVLARLKQTTRTPHLTQDAALYIPQLPYQSSPQTVAALMARLRAPNGCPWDLEQTHESLRAALLEETYEVLQALDENDPANLREELGDLLLHLLFQTQIARDENEFTLADVIAGLAAKLVRRHPHIFGSVRVTNAQQVVDNWEQIKREEKKTSGSKTSLESLDGGIPLELPALARAQKIYERARRRSLPPPKFNVKGKETIERPDELIQAYGEYLLELVAQAEDIGIDAESALREATAAYVKSAKKGSKKKRPAQKMTGDK